MSEKITKEKRELYTKRVGEVLTRLEKIKENLPPEYHPIVEKLAGELVYIAVTVDLYEPMYGELIGPEILQSMSRIKMYPSYIQEFRKTFGGIGGWWTARKLKNLFKNHEEYAIRKDIFGKHAEDIVEVVKIYKYLEDEIRKIYGKEMAEQLLPQLREALIEKELKKYIKDLQPLPKKIAEATKKAAEVACKICKEAGKPAPNWGIGLPRYEQKESNN